MSTTREKFEKAKAHVITHKEAYVSGAACAVFASFTTLVMRENTNLLSGLGSDLLSGSEGSGRTVVDNTTRSLAFAFKNGDISTVNNAHVSVHKSGRGAPGFVVRCLETGELFDSQSAAAKAFDVSISNMSSHLNGKFDNVYGNHFERLGVLS